MIAACMALHNVIIDMGEASDTQRRDLMHIRQTRDGCSSAPRTWVDTSGYIQVEGRPLVYSQNDCTTETVQGRRENKFGNVLRDELKERLGHAELWRPPHSRWGMQTAKKATRKRKTYYD